jgi:hypothetical protein
LLEDDNGDGACQDEDAMILVSEVLASLLRACFAGDLDWISWTVDQLFSDMVE